MTIEEKKFCESVWYQDREKELALMTERYKLCLYNQLLDEQMAEGVEI